jgi:hypothetical protein
MGSAPKPPTVQRTNGNGPSKEWQVKEVIPAGSTEREQALERMVEDLRRQVISLQNQVSRMQRFDHKRMKIAETQVAQAVLQSNLVLSETLGKLVGSQPVQDADFVSLTLDAKSKEQDERRKQIGEVARELAETTRLIRADKETTPVCPCGEHHGIRFVENGEVLVDSMCPMDWWHKQSNHAYYNGYLGDFMRDNPYKLSLKKYSI